MQGTDRLFTGTYALRMVKEHYDQTNSKTIDKWHWRIYLFMEFGEMFPLRKDMYVFYQVLYWLVMWFMCVCIYQLYNVSN